MVQQVLQRFGFRYSSPQSTPLPTGHSLSAPPSDESVEPSGPYPKLVGCLMVLRYLCSTSHMGLVLGVRGPVVLTRPVDASWADDLATQQSSQGYNFSLCSSSVSWRSTRSSSVLSSSCEAEIYAGAMAAQELRWLTYLVTDLGERPRSSPVLYVDNKAMIALCQEHRLEHRMKHIALRYFLAQELQQRGQLRLAYEATRANTTDIFTKALQSGPTDSFARSCLKRPCAIRPCSHSVALPCSYSHYLPPHTSRPATARASRSAAPRLTPCCSLHVAPSYLARRALLQPARRALLQLAPRRALLPCASRPAGASASRPTAANASRSAAPRVMPCCPAQRVPCPAARGAPCPAEPRHPAQAALPNPSRAALPSSPAPPSCPAATTAAAAADRATAAAGGGAAGSARSDAGAGSAGGATGSAGGAAGAGGATGSAGGAAGAGGATGSAGGAAGAGGATGSAGGAAGAGGAGPTTDRHCLSWPLSRQLQRLGVDSGGHCLSRTTPPLSSFAMEAAALGASEFAAALGAIESASDLGARASPATGPSSAEALHTFTLDSRASRCFFRDCTTLTPLAASVPVSLADPTGDPVVARASTVLPWQRVAICTCSRTGRHLATFTRRPGSSLYTLTTASAQVAKAGQLATSSQVSASGQLAASCSCWVLSHKTLLWHHRLGHPSLLRLHGMHSRLLVSGLPRSLPSLPRSPAPPCLPCIEGRQRTAPHSSEFPPTTAPLQTLHMDVWGPTPIGGMDQECYFLLVVDKYTRYTTVFPLRRKADVSGVLTPWIRATRRQLRERFSRDFRSCVCTLTEAPAAVDSGAKTASAEPRGAETEGEGYRGAATRGAGSGGAATGGAGSWCDATGGADSGGPTSPSGGGAVGDPAGGPGAGQPLQPDLLETLLPQAIRAWIVRRGSPGGGGYGLAGAGAASPGGTAGAGGIGALLRPRAASPFVTRLLTIVVTDPDLESTAAFALVTELVDFAARSRLDHVASLVTEFDSVCPPSVRDELALGSVVLEDRQFELECLAATLPRFASMLLCPEGDPDALDIPTLRSYAEVIAGEYSSQWQTSMDTEMASWKSTGTYVDEVPPPGAKIVDDMWIFRVKRPPGSPPAFKARYVARGFSLRQGVDLFHTFSPTPKMTTLWVLLHIAAQRDYQLHSLDFSTTFLQGSLHEEIWLRRPPSFTGSFPAVYVEDLVFATADTEALALVLQRFSFQFSSPQPTPLSTGHSLSAPPSEEYVEPSGPYPELVGCLMYLMTCTRPDLVYPLRLLARYVVPGRRRKVHSDDAKRVMRYMCSTSGMGLVLGGQGSVVLTGHFDAS
ncbi:unnamed protein product [Closterium sp. NIES-54]